MNGETLEDCVGLLLDWSSARVPGRAARLRRVPALFDFFRDLIVSERVTITVTGTSGKGSTCAILESLVAAQGHLPGLFTSPHLVSVTERIRIGGKPVPEAELVRHIRQLLLHLRLFVEKYGDDFRPSFFECLIVVASAMFSEAGVTDAVFEAAVGGANDATSFLPADASILTAVGLDHCDELGETIEAIARDKAGIAPTGGILILGAGLSSTATAAALTESARRNVRCIEARTDNLRTVASDIGGQLIEFGGGTTKQRIRLPWPGEHQLRNLATALCCLESLAQRGLTRHTSGVNGAVVPALPGRLEFIKGRPSWLLDVAHNMLSLEAALDTIRRYHRPEGVVPIMGFTEPHDYARMISLLASALGTLGLCEGFHRAVELPRLLAVVPQECRIYGAYSSPAQSIDHILSNRGAADTTFLVTGSLFLVGAWREQLKTQRGLPPQTTLRQKN